MAVMESTINDYECTVIFEFKPNDRQQCQHLLIKKIKAKTQKLRTMNYCGSKRWGQLNQNKISHSELLVTFM